MINMDEGLAVDDRGAPQSPAPDEYGHSNTHSSTKSLDDVPDFSGSYDAPNVKPHHLGVAVDPPDEDDEEIGFE